MERRETDRDRRETDRDRRETDRERDRQTGKGGHE